MKVKYSINNISNLEIPIKVPSIIFLNGDLGVGKTTLIKHILNNIIGVKNDIVSPTYTYYNRYTTNEKGGLITIYHFDLYRLSNYDEFFAIGGEEIFDNNSGIIFVEWPDLIKSYYKPDLEIFLEKTKEDNIRFISFGK